MLVSLTSMNFALGILYRDKCGDGTFGLRLFLQRVTTGFLLATEF